MTIDPSSMDQTSVEIQPLEKRLRPNSRGTSTHGFFSSILPIDFGYEDLSDRFREASFGSIDFEKQYASDYFIRLEKSRSALQAASESRWVDTKTIPSSQIVGHVKAYKSLEKDIVLFGVLFKDMALKPNVLSDIQDNLNLSESFMVPKGCSEISKRLSETDTIYLEDMEARLQLVFPPSQADDMRRLVTGVTIAVLGHVNDQGHFEVTDYTLPGYPTVPTMDLSSNDSPTYVAIVSGLQIGSPKTNPLALNLLRDFMIGASSSQTDRDLASRVARLVVAGDSIYFNQLKDPASTSIAEMDMYFSELSSVIPVDVMTGPRDPANYCLPQEPLHSGLFPNARRYANLTVHTNPYKFKVGDLVFLGTSGQNVTDVLQYSSLEDPLDCLELIANARYLAPTAPDTLACYPFTTVDPMVIDDESSSAARILFAGNQMSTGSRMLGNNPESGVVLVSVADFSVNPSLILININDTSDVRVVSFDVPKEI